MTDIIKEFIVEVFGDNVWLGILLVAMIPLIELRGAIPFAMGSAWGVHKLNWIQAYSSSVIGATIPALFIIPLLIPVFNFLRKTKLFKKLVDALDSKFSKKSEKLKNEVQNAETLRKAEVKKFWGTVAFVAIPLPLTGAWTGSAVAAYVKTGFWKGVLAIFLGNIISGAIMTALCVLFPVAVDMILNVFLILVLVLIIFSVVVMLFKKRKPQVENTEIK